MLTMWILTWHIMGKLANNVDPDMTYHGEAC